MVTVYYAYDPATYTYWVMGLLYVCREIVIEVPPIADSAQPAIAPHGPSAMRKHPVLVRASELYTGSLTITYPDAGP